MSAGDISKSARFLSVAGFLVTTLLIPFNLMRIISASLPDGSAQDYALVGPGHRVPAAPPVSKWSVLYACVGAVACIG